MEPGFSHFCGVGGRLMSGRPSYGTWGMGNVCPVVWQVRAGCYPLQTVYAGRVVSVTSLGSISSEFVSVRCAILLSHDG